MYTVGYIRIDYCKKPHEEACAEIQRYAGWSKQYETTGLGVGGIFVDETPNHFAPDRAEYLQGLKRFIKNAPGILADRFVSPSLILSWSSDGGNEVEDKRELMVNGG